MSAIKRLQLEKLVENSRNDYSGNQAQTAQTFGFQWELRHTYESEAVKEQTRKWLFERYCANDPGRLDRWLGNNRKIILDAGCGAGYSALLFFGERLNHHDYLGVDISSAMKVAKTRFAEAAIAGDFLQASITDLPLPNESVDMIFSEGVLHHTDNTEAALKFLTTKLKPGGYFLFYVYAKKPVIREFTDDYIRQQIKDKNDEEAWKVLEPLTKLGIALGEIGAEIDVPEDIPFLGIKKGKMDIQRFFYWNICKVFYRPEYTLDEMNLVTFDWFRPLNCFRHTPEEIKEWLADIHLTIEHMDAQESGITVVARKSAG